MNESKKIELASLLLSEDKELRKLAVNYIRSIYKNNFALRCSWDFDINDSYKVVSIVAACDNYENVLTLLFWIIENPEDFTTQSILDLINLIIDNNKNKNEG